MPTATLADLRRQTPWLWLSCDRHGCGWQAPLALAPLIIRWGPRASSDRLRVTARCRRCGGRGASTRLPSWGGSDVGWQDWPGG